MKKFRSLFSRNAAGPDKKESRESFPWRALEGAESLSPLTDAEDTHPKVVFKHSTRCGLSGMMLRRFEQHWDPVRDQVEFYLLDLLRHRELSGQVAEVFGIGHQSPQVLVIRAGSVTAHASHGDIDGLRPEAV